MKRISILLLAVVLVAAFTLPAAALENKFGGYWRTRFFSQNQFSGDKDTDVSDYQAVDTRTRLYYTAVINDNLQFVNKFEYDAVWGGGGTYGEIGADKTDIEIKNSYADWNMGPLNVRMGVQGLVQSRGFVFDDDGAGVVALWKMGDMLTLGAYWVRAWEGDSTTDRGNNGDFDLLGLQPTIAFGEAMTLKPYLLWYYSDDLDPDFADSGDTSYFPAGFDAEEVSSYMIGADFDATLGAFGLWFTGIYQGGTIDNASLAGGDEDDVDISAYLLAAGANTNLGIFDLHGEAFYASGDDDPDDDDIDGFVPLFGQSYYWAEIMGYGIFDQQVSAGAPADKISNVWAANLGAGLKPMDKLNVVLDVWYAQLAEDDVNGEDYLGTEVDLKVTYQLIEGLNLDLVGAYLFAGDATSLDGNNEDDPYELGARFSLSF
jgi:hypothetical protein